MAAFKTTIHHKNFTAVGRGPSVTFSNQCAILRYAEHIFNDYAENEIHFLQKLANEVRSARRGGVGEVKWRIDRDKSFIIVERV